MPENLFPTSIAGFTEYIKVAYAKAEESLSKYGVSADKLAPVTPLYDAYIRAEAVASNPETATTGARRTRDEAGEALKKEWRRFLNENIRYNSAVPAADLAVFGIRPRDATRTPAGIPGAVPALVIRRTSTRYYEVDVLDSATGKKKKPHYATGSNLYLAVTEVGQEPKHASDYHKLDFSSTGRHIIEFPLEQLAKQANLYARYSNAHGKEGPESTTEAVVIA
jgi:hypothetical protein